MNWFRVEVEQIRRNEWAAFLCHSEISVTAPSRKDVEEAARRLIEETEGAKHFDIVWIG